MKPDTYRSTARPPYAVTMWSDDRAIYVEIPCVGSAPYIQAYSLTEGGLSKALWLMRSAYEAAKPAAPANYTKHPKVRSFKPSTTTTEDQRSAAREALRKAGII